MYRSSTYILFLLERTKYISDKSKLHSTLLKMFQQTGKNMKLDANTNFNQMFFLSI